MTRIRIIILAVTIGTVPAFAQSRPGTVVALRSPEFHNGSHPWTMCRKAKAGAGGEALSQAGCKSADAAAWSKLAIRVASNTHRAKT